jgi:hypothetical protein
MLHWVKFSRVPLFFQCVLLIVVYNLLEAGRIFRK